MKNQFTQIFLLASAVSFFISSCAGNNEALNERNTEAREDSLKMQQALTARNKFENKVFASQETKAMPDSADWDTADDPAIWYNYQNPAKSLIIGTNKKRGLYVYNLDGDEVQVLETGLPNNVDLRDSVSIGNGKYKVIVACSNRTANTVDVLELDTAKLQLNSNLLCQIPSKLDEVYGFCLYYDKKNEKLYAFVNGKSGKIEQWRLDFNSSDSVKYALVRELALPDQPEGMVADDETGQLYVGEEEQGIHAFNADPEAITDGFIIEQSTSKNPNISFDIEGLAIIKKVTGEKYLIASIQGNFSYALFDINNNYNYAGSFVITENEVDGVEETDGLDVSIHPLPGYPDGILVVQDGFNQSENKLVAQNFKIISLSKVYQLIGGI